MPSNLNSTLSKIYRTFLHIFMSSNNESGWYGVPYSPTSIKDYCDRLQAQYKLEGVDQMESVTVLELKLFKTCTTSRHEYVAAKLLAPKGSVFLAFERGRGEDQVENKAQTGSPAGLTPLQQPAASSAVPSLSQSEDHLPLASSQTDVTAILPEKSSFLRNFTSPSIISPSLSSSSCSIASLDSLPRKRIAEDTVSALGSSGKKNNSDELICTLSFQNPSAPSSTPSSSSRPLHLYELATLAQTLHEISSSYLLISSNCYYFAGTIVKVVQELYHPTVVTAITGSEDTERKRGFLGGKGAGTWRGIEVYVGEKIDVAPLKEKFEKNVGMFREPVQQWEDSRGAKEAQLKAAEAEVSRLKLLLEQTAKLAILPRST